MTRLRLTTPVALALMALLSGPAFAQTDVLTNGSFESGLTGWTSATQLDPGAAGSCSYNAATASGTETSTGLPAFPPTAGTQLALSSVVSTSGVQNIINCVLYQDVAIPAGATRATFTYDIGAKGGTDGGINTGVRFGLYSTASLPSFNGPTVAGPSPFYATATPDTVLHSRSSTVNFNVSAIAGTTVRFAIMNGAFRTGTEVIGIDNVHLLVTVPSAPSSAFGAPTLSEWGLIALALLLGCTGFLALRQRLA